MNNLERLRLVSQIALKLQENYTTSQINIFLTGFGIQNTGETIVPSKRVYVENKLSNISEKIILSIAKELEIEIKNKVDNNSKHELLDVKERIVEYLLILDVPTIDLILDEYKAPTHYYGDFDDKKSYCKFKISELETIELNDLLEYLQKRKNKVNNPGFWVENKIRIFISHLAKDKKKASMLASELLKYDLTSFVAHEDIEPNEEWLVKIEEALMTMDVLLVLITEGFKESNWTAQEIGFALGRGVPVISIKNGMDSFGFFGKRQAVVGTGRIAKDIIRDVVEIIKKLPEFQDRISR